VSASSRPHGGADVANVEAVDALVAQTVEARVYSIEHEQRFTVTDSWDSGPECGRDDRRLVRHAAARRAGETNRGGFTAADR
jgi:hypothetical protein